ncbi:MAG TPA: glucose-1-phosphate cytidylyltransferase [Pirellulaceae bacterium]|nr:glucose-1-phosphate cytidylyltransferase [Pirellulaceae bacterium]
MKVVILAGGMGTRLQEQTETRPKPMVEIGGKPILWHIMKHFSHHEFSDFYIALGYLGDYIKEYFLARYSVSGHLSIDFATGQVHRRNADQERWSVNLVETGSHTMTGGRLKRLQSWLGDETFMLTYGDGVSDVDLHALTSFHRSQGKLVTLTAVRPPARFGGLTIQDGVVTEFAEKPAVGEGWINGGFMVLEPGVFDYLTDDTSVLESNLLEQAATDGQLAAYQHEGFWQCMDTLRDKLYLQKQWTSGQAPWRVWPLDAGESTGTRRSAA